MDGTLEGADYGWWYSTFYIITHSEITRDKAMARTIISSKTSVYRTWVICNLWQVEHGSTMDLSRPFQIGQFSRISAVSLRGQGNLFHKIYIA